MSIDTKELAEKCTRAIFDDESETPEEFAEAIQRELDAAALAGTPPDLLTPHDAYMEAELQDLQERRAEREANAKAREVRDAAVGEQIARQTAAMERIANALEGNASLGRCATCRRPTAGSDGLCAGCRDKP